MRRNYLVPLLILSLLALGCAVDRGALIELEGKALIGTRGVLGLVSLKPLRLTGDAKTAIAVTEGKITVQLEKNGEPDGSPIVVQKGGRLYLDELRKVEDPDRIAALLAFVYPRGVPDAMKPEPAQ